jgi:hypothetical protein
MNIRMFALVACLCGVAPGLAQDTAALAGAWQGEHQMPGGLFVEVLMRVDGAQGTWMATPRTPLRAPNPCLSRPLPITLSDAGTGTYKIDIHASKAIQGCRDGQATVKLVDGRVLDGKFGDGRPLKLERR